MHLGADPARERDVVGRQQRDELPAHLSHLVSGQVVDDHQTVQAEDLAIDLQNRLTRLVEDVVVLAEAKDLLANLIFHCLPPVGLPSPTAFARSLSEHQVAAKQVINSRRDSHLDAAPSESAATSRVCAPVRAIPPGTARAQGTALTHANHRQAATASRVARRSPRRLHATPSPPRRRATNPRACVAMSWPRAVRRASLPGPPVGFVSITTSPRLSRTPIAMLIASFETPDRRGRSRIAMD